MNTVVFPLGPLETNCYLVHTDKEAVAVDPGGNPAKVLKHLRENNLTLTHILCTHLHFDHTYGIHALTAATGAPVYASEADRYMLENEMGRGGMWGLPQVESYEFTGLEPGDMPMLGTTCRVLATPGHTPGGLSFYFASIQSVFSGDTLFYRSIGRTDFPGGDQNTLLSAIRTQLFTLPEETQAYSGHGMATSIGDEKRNNPHVSDFSV